MSKVIYSMMVSLDGFIEGPNQDLGWANVDEELHQFANDQAREMGAFLNGRRIYQVMAEYWSTADTNPSATEVEVEFARIWQAKPKIVFSRTLDKVEGNAKLVPENIAEEVAQLKEQLGQDLDLGGASIAATFMQLGLIDEYRLLVHPVVLGSGTPFFPASSNTINLRLVETRTFTSGVVYLRYERAGEGPPTRDE